MSSEPGPSTPAPALCSELWGTRPDHQCRASILERERERVSFFVPSPQSLFLDCKCPWEADKARNSSPRKCTHRERSGSPSCPHEGSGSGHIFLQVSIQCIVYTMWGAMWLAGIRGHERDMVLQLVEAPGSTCWMSDHMSRWMRKHRVPGTVPSRCSETVAVINGFFVRFNEELCTYSKSTLCSRKYMSFGECIVM